MKKSFLTWKYLFVPRTTQQKDLNCLYNLNGSKTDILNRVNESNISKREIRILFKAF